MQQLRFVSSFIALLSLAPASLQAQTKKQDPKWFACDIDSDCVVTPGGCSQPVPINKKFKKEAEDYYHWLRAISNCASKEKPETPQNTACVKNRCSLTLPAPQKDK